MASERTITDDENWAGGGVSFGPLRGPTVGQAAAQVRFELALDVVDAPPKLFEVAIHSLCRQQRARMRDVCDKYRRPFYLAKNHYERVDHRSEYCSHPYDQGRRREDEYDDHFSQLDEVAKSHLLRHAASCH